MSSSNTVKLILIYKVYDYRTKTCTFCFANPGSITNTTPSIVKDVSAMLVDTTTCLEISSI